MLEFATILKKIIIHLLSGELRRGMFRVSVVYLRPLGLAMYSPSYRYMLTLLGSAPNFLLKWSSL